MAGLVAGQMHSPATGGQDVGTMEGVPSSLSSLETRAQGKGR